MDSVTLQFSKLGDNHWGSPTDIRMLSEALSVGFLVLPDTTANGPEIPQGWIYALDINRGNFSHWLALYCIGNFHFQLAFLRCGEQASPTCFFTVQSLPAQLRDLYDSNNLHAPVGSEPGINFV